MANRDKGGRAAKTAAAKTPKEKKAAKRAKRDAAKTEPSKLN